MDKDPFSEAWEWTQVSPGVAAGEVRPWHAPLSDADAARFTRLCAALSLMYGNPPALIPGAKTSRSWHK